MIEWLINNILIIIRIKIIKILIVIVMIYVIIDWINYYLNILLMQVLN